MIDLTPLEVRQKKGDFRRAFRGYDAALVNDFLDLVADRMEELVKENLALQDRLEGLDEELQGFREKEKALVEALMAAERLRDDARANAEKEAQLLFKEAELEAERHRTAAAQALAQEETTIQRVRARRIQLIREFRSFLERELGELTVMEEALELQAAEDAAAGEEAPEEGASDEDEAEADDIETGETGEADEAVASAPEEDRLDDDDDLDDEDLDDDDEPGDDERGDDESDTNKDRQTDWLSSLVEE